jgi:hypothetical protein
VIDAAEAIPAGESPACGDSGRFLIVWLHHRDSTRDGNQDDSRKFTCPPGGTLMETPSIGSR